MSRFVAILVAAVSLSLSIGLVIGQAGAPAPAAAASPAATELSVLQSIDKKLGTADARLARLGPIRDRLAQLKTALTKSGVLTYKNMGIAQIVASEAVPSATSIDGTLTSPTMFVATGGTNYSLAGFTFPANLSYPLSGVTLTLRNCTQPNPFIQCDAILRVPVEFSGSTRYTP